MHPPGLCHVDGTRAYVNIPKNASTHLKRALGWPPTTDYVNRPCPLSAFAVIRDPIDRWFSGAAEHARRAERPLSEICDEVREGRYPVMDEHTMRQTDFLVSTFADLTLVKLSDAARFIAGFGATMEGPDERTWEPDQSLIPMLADFYADDIALYDSLG